MRKKIPAGSVFQRTYRDKKGNRRKTATWFIHYYANGKPVRLPTGTEDRQEAIRILREKLAKAARYNEYSEHAELVLVNQLLDLVLDDYRFSNRSTAYDAERRIEKHLRPFFGNTKAIAFTTAAIKKYTLIRARQAAAATVNKELAYLRRAFRLGFQNEPQLVEKVPNFRMLTVDNARSGILPHEKYRLIRDSLPSYARIALGSRLTLERARAKLPKFVRTRLISNAPALIFPAEQPRIGSRVTFPFTAT